MLVRSRVRATEIKLSQDCLGILPVHSGVQRACMPPTLLCKVLLSYSGCRAGSQLCDRQMRRGAAES
eukprot:6212945-Pleurochrysis_carterae.AAC.5